VTTPSARPFVLLLAVAVLAGAALLLVVPGYFGPDGLGGGVPLPVPAVLALVCVGCGVAARAARPDLPRRR